MIPPYKTSLGIFPSSICRTCHSHRSLRWQSIVKLFGSLHLDSTTVFGVLVVHVIKHLPQRTHIFNLDSLATYIVHDSFPYNRTQALITTIVIRTFCCFWVRVWCCWCCSSSYDTLTHRRQTHRSFDAACVGLLLNVLTSWFGAYFKVFNKHKFLYALLERHKK